MMTQMGALLLDAYRELNAKKMFWIVLILNVLVVGVFALLGANDHALTFLWWEIPIGGGPSFPPLYIYKSIFSTGIVGFWFTWLATLLALVSTAGIFPDFLSSGSVDLYLAKPISRLRLFFSKYIAGLLFVTLQVTVFTVLSFLVLGLRAGLWQFGLFWAIPLVVLFFSYIYSICVLLGTWTRSTVAALLLALLAWCGIWAVDAGERLVANIVDGPATRAAMLDDQIEEFDAAIAKAATQPAPESSTAPASQVTVYGGPAGGGPGSPPINFGPPEPGESIISLQSRRSDLVTQRSQIADVSNFESARKVAFAIKSLVPKTRETMNLLDRVLFTDTDLKSAVAPTDDTQPAARPRGFFRGGRRMRERELAQLERERQRPIVWVIGTSLIFEALMLALAAWHFCTRDF
jgi:ABC-type transport system involved in multi-copper enzyme maturation permease subunit